jgi:hypothetical protein
VLAKATGQKQADLIEREIVVAREVSRRRRALTFGGLDVGATAIADNGTLKLAERKV